MSKFDKSSYSAPQEWLEAFNENNILELISDICLYIFVIIF